MRQDLYLAERITEAVKKVVVNVASAVVAAGVAVGSVTANNIGSSKEIDLQSPSLIGPNAVTFDDFCSPGYEEAEDTGYVPMSLKNAKFNIDDYTIVAVKTYSDIASEFGTDPLDPITYDGSTFWLNSDAVLVAPKAEQASDEESDESEDSDEDSEEDNGNQDDVISLKLGDTVVRVAYTKEWSLVKLADGRQGYIMSSHLSADEIIPEAEQETEEDDYEEEDTSSSSSSSDTSSYSEPDYEPDDEPEESSGPDWEEWDVDFTVYASTALNTRTGPGISYTLLTTLSMGSEIEVVAETDNGWYKSSDGYYVKASFTQDDEPYIPEPVYYEDDDDDDYDSDEDWTDFASFVRNYIGCRYVYGGASPDGFDCSGFVMYCYEVYYGIYLPHGATSQSYCGEWVDPDDIQVGDIICFDKEGDGIMEHAGLYVGNDTYVHAQSSATGVVESCYSSAKWKIGTVRRVL